MANVDVTRIASNIGALNALNSLQNINAKLALHQTRLSTGKRINSAQDDPAGLTIATKMLARSEGLKVSLDNISDAKNMLSVAEGGLSKMTDIIVSMRSKAEQAASDTLGTSERAAIQDQLSAYAQQIQDLVDQTKWNGVKLLDNTSGNKVFQTGVDEGETTTWSLPNKLDPTTLNLSDVVSADTATFVDVSDSFSGGTTSSQLGSMSELTTGDYSFEILDKAVSTTQGKATLDTTSSLLSGVNALGTSVGAAAELTSGRYNVKITAATSTTSTSYIVTNLDDSSWNTTGSMTVTAANISGGNLVNGAAAALGVSLTFGTDPSGLVAGQSMNFEYIAKNEAKFELNDAAGSATQIARNAAGSISGLYSYKAAAGTFQTGRGVSITMGAFANMAAGETERFTYQQANNFSVDVSTTIKAGAYMTTANYALDKVTSALSGLGSLMARLSFKEEAISTAQVNVEGAYNRIMNANMAEEQVNASKYTILQQTATAMLAQANAAPQSLLALFR
ncbi:flagellin [Candidatus Villigracilis saccharophilus]|uniref:flagellin n=1 Tax=Candidatus Villigracilis saccharophilus TaxID=3140684 RepID=UPI003136FCF7|nr:flagellin [Anaerolineales bacterium]